MYSYLLSGPTSYWGALLSLAPRPSQDVFRHQRALLDRHGGKHRERPPSRRTDVGHIADGVDLGVAGHPGRLADNEAAAVSLAPGSASARGGAIRPATHTTALELILSPSVSVTPHSSASATVACRRTSTPSACSLPWAFFCIFPCSPDSRMSRLGVRPAAWRPDTA